MHLPYVQLASEVEQVAQDLAVILDWQEEPAGWGVYKLFKWALGRVPLGELPSAHDLVYGPNAAKLIARAAGYPGDPQAYVTAAQQVSAPFLEQMPDGIRIRGLDRYDVVPENAKGRSEKAKHAAKARWDIPTDARPMLGACSADAQAMLGACSTDAQGMLGDAKTQTQTQIKKEALEAAPKQETKKPAQTGPDLRDRLEAVFLKSKSAAYSWDQNRDDAAIRSLLGKGTWDEICRRWQIALARGGYPACASLPELLRNWNHYATEQAAQPRRPGDAPPPGQLREGTVRLKPAGGEK